MAGGDETAFMSLVERYHPELIQIASLYVPNRSVAEEVAQETWQGVLQGLHRFEGRSSLKTWIFRILVNCAKTRAAREGRCVPFSSLWRPEQEPGEPAVDPARFRDSDPWRNDRRATPRSWGDIPEERFLAQEMLACVRDATVTSAASRSDTSRTICSRSV